MLKCCLDLEYFFRLFFGFVSFPSDVLPTNAVLFLGLTLFTVSNELRKYFKVYY